MSKGLSYCLGILTGILLTVGFLAIRKATTKEDVATITEKTESPEKQDKLPDGVTLLDEPIPFNEAKNFKILQVVFEDAALAQSEKKEPYIGSYYTDPVVLIISEQKNTFYDDQIVKCPKDSKVIQVGTYQYQTKMGWKTVPIVSFVKPQ